jgi:hypothetical protein
MGTRVSYKMDITNIPQTLIKALEQKNTDQLVVLSRVLNLALGKTVMANIISAEPVTALERAELLKQTAAALAQIKQQATNNLTPALKTEMARLIQQQNLIQSVELKWINVMVNNRPLLTYSDRPLVTGQTVPVQLQSPQKLVLVDLPTLEQWAQTKVATAMALTSLSAKASTLATNVPAETVKNSAGLNELLKSVISELASKSLTTFAANSINLVKNSVATATVTNTARLANNLATTELSYKSPTNNILAAENNDSTSVLTKNIASATPLQDINSKAALLIKAINYSTNELSLKYSATADRKNTSPEIVAAKNIVSESLRHLLPHRDAPNLLLSAINKLQQLPAASRLQLLSPSVEQAVKSIAEKIRSPEQLTQPKALAQTLKNSGIFFENKLHETVQKNTEANASKPTSSVNTTYAQDLKGALLTLLNRVTQELNGDRKPLSNEQTIKLLKNLSGPTPLQPSGIASTNPFNAKIDIAQAAGMSIGMFIQQLMHKPVKELSDKELRTQLLVLLQQHSVHSLAKIQLQQLHSVNHELETKDSASPNASWQIDIPVKQHNDVQHLHMRIDREWVDEKSESNSTKNIQKIKHWSVTLRFDLPTLGEFCAQLAVINTQVSATLWAAQEKTFIDVRNHIEGLRKQLESEGIDVKYLQCMRGMPPEKPMALSYSLIDIST